MRYVLAGVVLLALWPASAMAQSEGDATPVPIVVQGAVVSLRAEGDHWLVTLRTEVGRQVPGPWVMVAVPDAALDRNLDRGALCGRFTGAWDGADTAVLVTPALGLPYTVTAPRLAATTSATAHPSSRTATGCDLPPVQARPDERFDPSTMLPQ